MIVLRANNEQFLALDGYTYNESQLRFAPHNVLGWIVGLKVLDNPDMAAIRDQLDALERVTFVPQTEEEEE